MQNSASCPAQDNLFRKGNDIMDKLPGPLLNYPLTIKYLQLLYHRLHKMSMIIKQRNKANKMIK